MWTWLRRAFWLSLVCGAGYALYAVWQRQQEPALDGPPEWPPLDVSSREAAIDVADDVANDDAPTGLGEESGTGSTGAAWVTPIEGRCPDGFPIKANDKSGIFHVPGGRFYERTIPERCYPDEASALSDGYRRAKA